MHLVALPGYVPQHTTVHPSRSRSADVLEMWNLIAVWCHSASNSKKPTEMAISGATSARSCVSKSPQDGHFLLKMFFHLLPVIRSEKSCRWFAQRRFLATSALDVPTPRKGSPDNTIWWPKSRPNDVLLYLNPAFVTSRMPNKFVNVFHIVFSKVTVNSCHVKQAALSAMIATFL